jgi:putative ABC transport system ATP-binding protein
MEDHEQRDGGDGDGDGEPDREAKSVTGNSVHDSPHENSMGKGYSKTGAAGKRAGQRIESGWNGNADEEAMTGKNLLLRAEGLQREVAGKKIVREATFALKAGEVVAITGPSGAGKSSVLRLLNRLDEPTAGRVWLEDSDAAGLPVRELRRRVGMVMQQANLFPGTVAENVRYGPALHKVEMSAAEVEELLRTVALGGYAERDVAGLSGGEAQRVSLARTLANHPQVLLLDEPTSALDDEAKLVVEEALRAAMARVKGACLIVTHDSAQAARLAQRTLVMRDGVLRSNIGSLPE